MYVAFVVHARGSVPHDLREASPGLRTYSGPLRFNATRSLYVTVRVVIVRLVGRPRHEPVRMIDRLRNKVTQFSSFLPAKPKACASQCDVGCTTASIAGP